MIKIEKIVVKENIRKDYGDLTELTASIKENGIRQPLELNVDSELIDGHRRLKAAKAAGLDEVPYFYCEIGVNKTAEELITGIFQKNLNPIEEGKAFKKYLYEIKVEVVTLASRISKSESYIEKRLALLSLPEDAQKAIISKKIQLGHALILAKMPKNDAVNFMKEITRQDYSVAATRSALQYHEQSKTISEAKFNKIDCKDCKHNGSVQSELFETGKVLTGKCLNPGCFNKKTAEYVKESKKVFKDVLFKSVNGSISPDGFVDGEYESSCSDEGITDAYKKKLRKEKNPENYIVKIGDTGMMTEYFKPPKKKSGPTDEKQKAVSRSGKLQEKIDAYKRDVLIDETRELLGVRNNKIIALALRDLIETNYSNQFKDEAIKAIGLKEHAPGYMKSILNLSSEKIDDGMVAITKIAISNIHKLEDLEVTAIEFGFNWEKQFEMTEEYLKLYTKDQMIKLAKELKIDVSECTKNKEFRDIIIKNWKKGQVPKVLGGK